MGCNVSPYRGGVLKYKDTVTATVDSITAGETKTFFTASDYCIVKVVCLSDVSNCNFRINNTNAGTFGKIFMESKQSRELSNRQEFLSGATYSAQDSYNVYYGNVLLLLKPGDELQIYCSYGTFTDVQSKVYLYKIE
jgi:hypothetical protein